MNWKNKVWIIGAFAGLAMGLVGAYIIIRRSEELDTLPELSPGDGVKIGLGVLGVLRLIADVAEKG
ncbi:MAG: hypothetical protein EHM21_03090 [Chloroflexi bacterium]|nr:MAG: hypothetical protein EHM21_03090 [Chloroflexota bacterium]